MSSSSELGTNTIQLSGGYNKVFKKQGGNTHFPTKETFLLMLRRSLSETEAVKVT